MSAFNALEKRVLDLSLAGVSDQPERVVVVGLFTAQPAENHDGAYGKNGEPAKAAAGSTGYKRAAVRFLPTTATSAEFATNADTITITGLPPGTYTHFGIFGSTTAGA